MLKKLKLLFFSNNNIEKNNKETITLDIEWEDVSSGSILEGAMRKNGIRGHVKSGSLVLEDGSVYIPTELSHHWEAYIGSHKFKPKAITYKLSK